MIDVDSAAIGDHLEAVRLERTSRYLRRWRDDIQGRWAVNHDGSRQK